VGSSCLVLRPLHCFASMQAVVVVDEGQWQQINLVISPYITSGTQTSCVVPVRFTTSNLIKSMCAPYSPSICSCAPGGSNSSSRHTRHRDRGSQHWYPAVQRQGKEARVRWGCCCIRAMMMMLLLQQCVGCACDTAMSSTACPQRQQIDTLTYTVCKHYCRSGCILVMTRGESSLAYWIA